MGSHRPTPAASPSWSGPSASTSHSRTRRRTQRRRRRRCGDETYGGGGIELVVKVVFGLNLFGPVEKFVRLVVTVRPTGPAPCTMGPLLRTAPIPTPPPPLLTCAPAIPLPPPLLCPCPCAAMAVELTPSAATADNATSVLRNIAFLLFIVRRHNCRRTVTPKDAKKCRLTASNIWECRVFAAVT